MNKAFTNFTWVDEPYRDTPTSAENFNKLNTAINTIDDRVVSHDVAVGKLQIGNDVYEAVISTTDAGQTGKIVFVVSE